VTLPLGREELVLETGRLAKQANGAVYAEYAGSAVLATVCCSAGAIEGLDYVPLQVEYNEKAYAAGKIPGSIFKREGRPKDREILVSRLIDRPLRPLFSKQFKRDIQVVPTVVSADQVNPPDMVAMVAASAAVTLSDIPFDGPVGAVRVAEVDGSLIVNPTYEERDRARLEIVVAGTGTGITMVEGGALEAEEQRLVEAINLAHEQIKALCALQLDLAGRANAGAKLPLPESMPPLAVHDELWQWALPKMEEACFVRGKFERAAAVKAVGTSALDQFAERIPEEDSARAEALLEELETQVVRESILGRQVRTDGRGPDDIRPIACEVDVLPRAHGAALFTRGETQALALTTLGSEGDELRVLDALETDQDTRKHFMLHYNFPPFSVGETGRLGTGRREVGHGHLAERALEAVIPAKETFPYTIRLVSEILESNGSSSMASVCGGTLSLLNAGVPITKSVAGIAMGLVTDGNRHVVLSDILGEEDHLGDMDFKVAGTRDGITAFQMDIKVAGVDQAVLQQALERARAGRLKILDIMAETIDAPRAEISDYAPKIMSTSIPEDKIGALIGTGGANIRSITEQSGADVNIRDDGTVFIYARRKK
jgi:polyribonucleotide nucleotidyltransferase